MSLLMWIGWGLLCIAQNFAFTFVSRARNSGSLKKHMVAGLFSNGVWFVGQIFAVGAFMSILSGHFGVLLAIFAGVYYTILTLTGSLLAHQYALKTEKGTARVGAHKDVASFTLAEGVMVRTRALFVDTGDGVGTFTPEELAALKELVGTKLEVVDETVIESVPDATGYSQNAAPVASNSGNGLSPAWQPADITKFAPGIPGQGAKL